jgi:hypothetical protein
VRPPHPKPKRLLMFPGGLQETSGAVGDVLGNSMDMRGGQSKKSDEAGKAIGDLGKGECEWDRCGEWAKLMFGGF